MDIDPGYKCIEKLRGDIQWCTMESKDFTPIFSFKLRIENGNSVCFASQSITFRLSTKEVLFFFQ